MNYSELGYNNLFQKNSFPPAPVEVTEDTSSQTIPLLTGSSVAGGVTSSTTGKIQIDWEKGQILVGDGANWRVLIGEDGL